MCLQPARPCATDRAPSTNESRGRGAILLPSRSFWAPMWPGGRMDGSGQWAVGRRQEPRGQVVVGWAKAGRPCPRGEEAVSTGARRWARRRATGQVEIRAENGAGGRRWSRPRLAGGKGSREGRGVRSETARGPDAAAALPGPGAANSRPVATKPPGERDRLPGPSKSFQELFSEYRARNSRGARRPPRHLPPEPAEFRHFRTLKRIRRLFLRRGVDSQKVSRLYIASHEGGVAAGGPAICLGFLSQSVRPIRSGESLVCAAIKGESPCGQTMDHLHRVL